MDPIRHILVATDFSEPASWALASAVGLGQSFGAKLTVATVVQPYRPLSLAEASLTGHDVEAPFVHDAEEGLKKLRADSIPATLDVHLKALVDLSPAGSITDYAEEKEIDLIVLGTRGRGGFRRLLLGSVAEQVVRYAHCPVLTLGRQAFQSSALQSGIAVAADLTEGSEPALDAAQTLAKAFTTAVTVVHVHDPAVPYPAPGTVREAWAKPEIVEQELQKRLDALCASHFEPGLSVSNELLSDDDPVDAVVAFAERTKPELLVIATHGRTGVRRTLMGSISEQVVRRAPCPVLTVHRPDG